MLKTAKPHVITITLGSINAIQVLRATIECPTEDNVSVVLDVQGTMVDDNGGVSGAILLPRVALDPAEAMAVYAVVRDAIYKAVRLSSPDVSAEAELVELTTKDVTP